MKSHKRIFKKLSMGVLPTCLMATILALPSPQALGFGIGFLSMSHDEPKLYGTPVHQVITELAIEGSHILDSRYGYEVAKPKGDSSESDPAKLSPRELAKSQILQGVVFNDDPEGLSFPGNPEFEKGRSILDFVKTFLKFDGTASKKSAIEQSHFGYFQFLHAMGTGSLTNGREAQSRKDVRDRILAYSEHCWQMATQEKSFEEFKSVFMSIHAKIDNAKILKEEGKINNFRNAEEVRKLLNLSNNEARLWRALSSFGVDTIFFHASNQEQFRNRALGSILHIIQDSYAKGHTVRDNWEKENDGAIRYFQDYSQQNDRYHGAHDIPATGKVDKNNFNTVAGASKALEQTQKLLVMAANNCPWALTRDVPMLPSGCDQTVEDFLKNNVFAFSESTEKATFTHSHKDLEKETPVTP